MRKVKAIIEQTSDGNYSVFMDAEDMDYLVTGTGKTEEEAIQCFKDGYEDTKRYYAEEGKAFEEVEFVFVHSSMTAAYNRWSRRAPLMATHYPSFEGGVSYILEQVEDILYRRYSDDGDPDQRWIDLKNLVELFKV